MMSPNQDKARWREARTLDGVRELNAQYLLGRLASCPWYGGPPDPETVNIRRPLVQLNRLGYLTEVSQPGVPSDGEGNGQRAFVGGFAESLLAKRIAAVGLYSDIVVTYVEPENNGCEIPLTVDGFRLFTGAPNYTEHPACGDSLDDLAPWFSPSVLAQFRSLWYVTAIDPRWGRKRYLWQHLLRVLRQTTDKDQYTIERDE